MVAKNPSSPPSALEHLARSKDFDVLVEVAAHPATPAQVLDTLANDEHLSVVQNVALNPNTPVATLERLAASEGESIRLSAAWNPNAPAALRTLRVKPRSWTVREVHAVLYDNLQTCPSCGGTIHVSYSPGGSQGDYWEYSCSGCDNHCDR